MGKHTRERSFEGKQAKATVSWTEAEARALLEQWRGSGLSLGEFGRERGVSGQRLGYWEKRLMPRAATKITKREEAPPRRFIPAMINTGVGPSTGYDVAVVTDEGARIELRSAGVSAEWLAQLMCALDLRTGR